MNESERRFALRAVRRKRLFLALSALGLAVGLGLAAFYGYRRATDPGFHVGARFALVLLILLNARQNLRQYRYAMLLEQLMGRDE